MREWRFYVEVDDVTGRGNGDGKGGGGRSEGEGDDVLQLDL